MYIRDYLSVLQFFKDYINAAGGVGELKKALDWSVWYAAKWWQEVMDAGVASRNNAFIRALYMSLLLRGLIDERGNSKAAISKPSLPRGFYAREWVEMHQKFDEIGAVNVATDSVDRNTLDMLYSDVQIQGWHKVMIRGILKAAGVNDGMAVLEPYSREGHLAQQYMEEYKAASYLGYDPRSAMVEIARATVPHAEFKDVPSACQLGGTFDLALLIEKLQWFADPATELRCIKKLLKPGGLVLVAQPVAESMPGYLAIMASIDGVSVYTWKEVERILKLQFTLKRRLTAAMPLYVAVWRV